MPQVSTHVTISSVVPLLMRRRRCHYRWLLMEQKQDADLIVTTAMAVLKLARHCAAARVC